jgi:uncharacterized protein YbaR (Trm112 family)
MDKNILHFLKCPACNSYQLAIDEISTYNQTEVNEGIIWCTNCMTWYPIENGLLEFLSGDLIYHEDREKFAEKHQERLKK